MGKSSTSSARDSKRDVTGSETSSLRSSTRGHDSSSSSSSRRRSRSRSPKAPKARRPAEMPRKRKSTGAETSSPSSSPSSSTEVATKSDSNANGSTFGISPTALFSNLQSAYSVFQSLPNLTGGSAAAATAPNGVLPPFTTSYELALPDTPVTNLLSPSNLRLPASQDVLQTRLATNLPRHGNAYAILLVGTLLTSHWFILTALFGIVKFGLFIQSYNGRDIARDLGVRKYASSQAIMSGFAAAAALVGLWVFSSVFSVVATVVKVATLVLVHAAFFELDEAAQRKLQQQRAPSVSSASGVPPPVLRPAGTALSPRDAVALTSQLRSVSEGHLSTVHSNGNNGWYAGEGYVGSSRDDQYAAMPRSSRALDQFPPGRVEDEDEIDRGASWGFNEAGRPQSYAGRSY
ncbi:hypothetical protein CkaCkLH20_08104 [Colletotrichum karsti]|uniref:PRA1 family protein n=1 Tax=Colletotrichum karsti TaxID=1095194 RepID=A0A9P6I3Z8_9PEZI|nr:uncharacterized protein CkaCkLH20_08104 [Colletotrichum karsti]KAF9874541.1 hypothetical protein CkaCkLH20_08104 [Colletotrichum karsti]